MTHRAGNTATGQLCLSARQTDTCVVKRLPLQIVANFLMLRWYGPKATRGYLDALGITVRLSMFE